MNKNVLVHVRRILHPGRLAVWASPLLLAPTLLAYAADGGLGIQPAIGSGPSDGARRSGLLQITQTDVPPEPPPDTPVPPPAEPPTAIPVATETQPAPATATEAGAPADTATPVPAVSASPTAVPSNTATPTNTSVPTSTPTEAPVAAIALGIGDPIESLTGTGATPPSYCIRINSTLRAYGDVNNSNLFYGLYLPGAPAFWQTTRYDVPRLDDGEAWSPPTWSVCNPPQAGTYTIFACWSRGSSLNCQIDFAYTSFYSVPTLGLPLGLVSLGLLGSFLWKRRHLFARGSA
jgi:hypothetical protein